MREPASVVARSVPLPARVLPLRRSAGVDPTYGFRTIGAGDVRQPATKVMPPPHKGADDRGDSGMRLNSAQRGGQTPDYIAFRIPEGRGLLTVVAAVQPGARAASPWAVWYSTLAPAGEFRKSPVNYIRLGIGARIAKTMIEVIKSGGSLPASLVEQLPIVKL
jgi:hypothetical protein